MSDSPENQPTAAIPPPPPTNSVQVAAESSTTAIPSPLQAPYGLKKDGTPKKKHTGGKNGARPPGIPNTALKRTYDPEQLAKDVAITLSKGQGIMRAPTLRTLSEPDRRSLAASLQEPVEAFNDRLASKLRSIADKLADSIEHDVDNGLFKPGEKGFIFSVMHDKRLSLDGSRALNNASVNVTVNNFGPSPKAQLLTELDGMTNVSPKVIEVNPDQTSVHTESISGLVAMDSRPRSQKVS
jgi:hypothetical protein